MTSPSTDTELLDGKTHDVRRPSALTLSTRYEMAVDAVTEQKPFASDAVRHYLVTLAASLDEYALRQPANGLLDVKVLEAIDLFLPALKDYRRVVSALAGAPDAKVHADHLVNFLRDVIAYKGALAQEQDCVLWSDQYRFLVRELFLSTVAIFLRHERYDATAVLLS
ncbi:MAG: hypothetical protein AAFU65_15260, partial [Pseudomonadota bacterium]